jgi:hypothetical protein
MNRMDRIIIVLMGASMCLGIILTITFTSNQSKEVIILQAKLDRANKDILYYRTQYLKANTQLIEIKSKCIYCAD